MASFFHSLIILFFVSLLISRISFASSGYPKIFLSRLQSNSNPGVISLSSQEGNVVRRNLLNSFPERWKIKLKNYIKIYPTQQNFLSFRILSFHIHPQAPLNNTFKLLLHRVLLLAAKAPALVICLSVCLSVHGQTCFVN